MFRLLTMISVTCALASAAVAQTHNPPPRHPPAGQKASPPDTSTLPPDLKYEGKATSSDPSAFPGEVDNRGYPGGVGENPR